MLIGRVQARKEKKDLASISLNESLSTAPSHVHTCLHEFVSNVQSMHQTTRTRTRRDREEAKRESAQVCSRIRTTNICLFCVRFSNPHTSPRDNFVSFAATVRSYHLVTYDREHSWPLLMSTCVVPRGEPRVPYCEAPPPQEPAEAKQLPQPPSEHCPQPSSTHQSQRTGTAATDSHW